MPLPITIVGFHKKYRELHGSDKACWVHRADSLLPDIRIIAPSQERGLDDDYYMYEER